MIKFKVYFWKGMPRGMFKEYRKKYKDRQKDYMQVYVCKDFKEMYDLTDKLEGEELKRDYGARTYCYSKNFYSIEEHKYIKTSPCCGHIVFNEEYFYIDSISHESCHAVIGYVSRKLKELQSMFIQTDDIGVICEEKEDEIEKDLKEELFCYMLGSLTNQIVCGVEDAEKEK